MKKTIIITINGQLMGTLKNYFQVLNNNYHILPISDCIDGNYNDSFELIENIEILTETL